MIPCTSATPSSTRSPCCCRSTAPDADARTAACAPPAGTALRPAVVRAVLADGTTVYSGLAYRGRARGHPGLQGRGAHRARRNARGRARRPRSSSRSLRSTRRHRRRRRDLRRPRRAGPRDVDGATTRCRLLLARAGLRGAPVFAVGAAASPRRRRCPLVERRSNLDGAFRLRRAVAGRRFVLVDDVVTTGATLLEAARTLRDGGAEVVAAVTVATTPRRFGPAGSSRSGGLRNPFRDIPGKRD